ncbi:MAG: phospholipase D-like domain-containing protein, partial [Candidatus Korarchaeota archaeon]
MTKNRITLLVTGLELFHPKVRSIDAVIKELIQESRKELHIATYLLTIGASHIIEELEKAAKRGVKVIFLIDRLESKNPVIKKKLGMLDEYPNVDIISFSDPKWGHLHAKVLVMDRVKEVIGSA